MKKVQDAVFTILSITALFASMFLLVILVAQKAHASEECVSPCEPYLGIGGAHRSMGYKPTGGQKDFSHNSQELQGILGVKLTDTVGVEIGHGFSGRKFKNHGHSSIKSSHLGFLHYHALDSDTYFVTKAALVRHMTRNQAKGKDEVQMRKNSPSFFGYIQQKIGRVSLRGGLGYHFTSSLKSDDIKAKDSTTLEAMIVAPF